ncbi:unnamed protein product, partial [Rotaria sordida]
MYRIYGTKSPRLIETNLTDIQSISSRISSERRYRSPPLAIILSIFGGCCLCAMLTAVVVIPLALSLTNSNQESNTITTVTTVTSVTSTTTTSTTSTSTTSTSTTSTSTSTTSTSTSTVATT